MLKRSKDENEVRVTIVPDNRDSQGTESERAAEAEQSAENVRGEIEKLRTQAAEKDQELAEIKDKYLRLLADSENVRKRLRQQSEESVRLQRENLLREILPMVDNLERAVAAASGGGNGKSIVEGVEMVLRAMLDFLKAQGVTQLSAVGQPFDPQRHEAADQVATAEHPPNTVINEFHRGYLIGDRTLRPARVAVAKAGGGGDGRGKAGAGEVENS
jgi:molecular chaperone GrpE